MEFYCILFCNGSGAVRVAGLRQVVFPPTRGGHRRGCSSAACRLCPLTV